MYHDDEQNDAGDKIADRIRKTKRHDDNPERVVLEAGKKRAPLAPIDNRASQVLEMSSSNDVSLISVGIFHPRSP
jgi:hypothetical protein